MKTIAILMVLALHVSLWNCDIISSRTWMRYIQYAMQLISEGVPIFVFVNGFLLLPKQNFDLKKHLMKMGKIMGIIVVWSVILNIIGTILSGGEVSLSVLWSFLQTQLGSGNTGVLWFLQSLLGIYCLYPIMWKIYHSDFKLFKYFFVIVIIFSLVIPTLQLIKRLVVYYMIDVTILDQTISFISQFVPLGDVVFMFYFTLGGMVFHYWDRIKAYRCYIIIGGIAAWFLAFCYGYTITYKSGALFASFTYGSVFMIPILLAWMCATSSYENKGGLLHRFIMSVSCNTMGIYLSHIMFIRIVCRFIPINTMYNRILVFGIVFILSYLFSLIIGSVPFLKQLIKV